MDEGKTKEELFEEYTRLVDEETVLIKKVQTYKECMSAILRHLFKYGDKIELLTVEDVLTLVRNKKLEVRTE